MSPERPFPALGSPRGASRQTVRGSRRPDGARRDTPLWQARYAGQQVGATSVGVARESAPAQRRPSSQRLQRSRAVFSQTVLAPAVSTVTTCTRNRCVSRTAARLTRTGPWPVWQTRRMHSHRWRRWAARGIQGAAASRRRGPPGVHRRPAPTASRRPGGVPKRLQGRPRGRRAFRGTAPRVHREGSARASPPAPALGAP